MTNYRIKVRNSEGWENYNNCKLNVSVSQPTLNGEKLESIIHWINENFDHCIVSIGDTLNRYNLIQDQKLSLKKAHEVTRQSGEDWIKRNRKALNQFRISHEILQWDESLTETALNLMKQYEELYNNHEGFRQAVDEDVSRYSKRKSIEAKEYILEELGVDTEIARHYPNATIYPGKALSSYDYIRENGKAISAPYGLENEHHVYVDPRRIKQSQADRLKKELIA